MTRHIIGRAAFSGAVALALVFGGRTALAAPAEARTEAAACTWDSDCTSYCRWWYGAGYYGYCVVGQCYCRYTG